jgi:hypothetical protein
MDVVVWAYNPRYSGAEVEGYQFKVSLGKSTRLCLQNKLKEKGLGPWLEWSSAYLAIPSTAKK